MENLDWFVLNNVPFMNYLNANEYQIKLKDSDTILDHSDRVGEYIFSQLRALFEQITTDETHAKPDHLSNSKSTRANSGFKRTTPSLCN